MKKLVLLFSLVLFTTSCSYVSKMWKSYPQDNVVEEITEDIIENQTGLDLDLSPFSQEV